MICLGARPTKGILCARFRPAGRASRPVPTLPLAGSMDGQGGPSCGEGGPRIEENMAPSQITLGAAVRSPMEEGGPRPDRVRGLPSAYLPYSTARRATRSRSSAVGAWASRRR